MQQLSTIVIILAVIFALAWICMPFMIMGVNKRLDKLIELQSNNKAKTKNKAHEGPKYHTDGLNLNGIFWIVVIVVILIGIYLAA